MSWTERMESFTTGLWGATAAAVVSFVVWLVRTIFTNQKQIRKLEEDLARRERAHKQEMEARDAGRLQEQHVIQEMHKDIREIRTAVFKGLTEARVERRHTHDED